MPEGDLDAAEARLLEVLDRADADAAPLNDAVMAALNALGVVYKYAARFDDADDAYNRALVMAKAGVEPDVLILAALFHNLGGLDHARNNPLPGTVWAEKGLGLRVAALGPDHPDTARELAALGALYQQAGRMKDAAAAYQRSLVVFESSLGPDHYEVGMTVSNMAALASDDRRHDEAITLGRRALRILEAVLGPDHPEVGLTLHNLGVALLNAGMTVEARSTLLRAQQVVGASFPPGHPHLGAISSALDIVGLL